MANRSERSAVDDLAPSLVSVVGTDSVVLSDLFSLMEHNYSAYAHATNVASYSVALAYQLGIHERSELIEVCAAALLHDVGKRHVPSDWLNAPQRLNGRKLDAIRDHPRAGFDDLCRREELSWGQLMIVYQHHEHVDGSGYPVGALQGEIHEWARVCAVADAFDKHTSHQPARGAKPVDKALDVLLSQAGTQYDKEIVDCWVKTMK